MPNPRRPGDLASEALSLAGLSRREEEGVAAPRAGRGEVRVLGVQRHAQRAAPDDAAAHIRHQLADPGSLAGAALAKSEG